jgi:predicted alpha/beta hydrolase
VTLDDPPCQQLWCDRGEERLGVQLYDPPGPQAPAVVIWSAMGVPARFYRPFALRLRDLGLAVAVVDLRGTGASTPRPSRASTYGYAELVDDVGAVLAELKPALGARRLLLFGHSLGGMLCLLHLARLAAAEGGGRRDAAGGVDGLVLVATGTPYWRLFPGPRGLGVLPFACALHATATVLRVWPGWGFGGRQARGVIRDWALGARSGRLPRLGGRDPVEDFGLVATPVLAISFERDQYTPAPIVDHLVARLTAPVQREHYDGGVDHFQWARNDATPVAARVAAFAHAL